MTTPADVFVHLLPLPVHGATTKNEDGTYSVFLNANDSMERRMKAYQHEMNHIENNDLELKDAGCEERAHRDS